ncbi:hypothetical protein M2282_006105 [Variovorax boronicumulans]|nr:hypothetical protein [Variovorax boronicumulans]
MPNQHIHIDEILRFAQDKILVGDIAPPDDRHHSIRDEQLVVHTVVQSSHVERRSCEARQEPVTPAAERIEEAHRDVGRF